MPTFVPPGFKMPLEDIRDVRGWVRDRVTRFFENGATPTADEFDEACDQGLLILLEIHKAWDPARCERFSAYAMTIFGKRLIDYWRREVTTSGRGHVPREGANGNARGKLIYHGMVSLDSAETVETFHADRALVHFDPGE